MRASIGRRPDPIKVARMFRRLGPAKDMIADIARVEALVRDRFRVPESDLVLVTQDPGMKPGFPPIETNVVFWKDRKRYRLKVFAPVAQVTDADLPVAWLLPALEDTGESACC
jgi:hypothetical protein